MQLRMIEYLVNSISASGAHIQKADESTILELLKLYKIPFSKSMSDKQTQININANDLFRFDLGLSDKILLTQSNILYQLPLQLQSKIRNGINTNFLALMRHIQPIELHQLNQVKSKHSYELYYLSKKSNRFEKRTITTKKAITLGSQLFIEAFCFKRKRIRWFEYGRIKKIFSTSYFPIPEEAKHYGSEFTLKFKPSELTILKWYFRDIMKSYTNTTMRIHVCDFDYLKKELQNMNRVQLLKT